MSVHEVSGNRFAFPMENLLEGIEEGLEEDTRLIQIGGQFSF